MSHKNYLLTFISFIFATLLACFIADFGARTIPSPYKTKFDTITKNNIRVKNLILGSSHFYYGVNPKHFTEPTFNGANVSQDLKYDLFFLELALDHQKSITHVVVPLSVFSLYYELDSGIESWRKYSYRIYWKDKNYPASELYDISNHSLIYSNQSKLGLVKRAAEKFLDPNTKQDWSSDGWGNGYVTVADASTLQITGKQAAVRHQKDAKFSQKSLGSLNKIVEVCRSRGIKLLIVTPPAYISYRRNIKNTRLDIIAGVALKITTLNSNVKYISYFSDVSFDSNDYFDADHLNSHGAEKLSRMIDGAITNWR